MKGEDVTKLASMCKLKAGRLAREVSDSCLQYWGEWASQMKYLCPDPTGTCVLHLHNAL